jgi:TldD protein
MSSSPSNSEITTGRYLDQRKIGNALQQAVDFGASYAEVRLVAETGSSVNLRDGILENAIPGQEVGVTLRILADGAWGVHSTTDIASLPEQIESTVRLAKAVAKRRSSSDKPVKLAEIPIFQDGVCSILLPAPASTPASFIKCIRHIQNKTIVL